MNGTRRLAVAGLAIAVLAGGAAHGGSIWARASRRTRELFSDDIARDVGDILDVVIAEKTKIETETNRKMDKKTSRSAKAGGGVHLKDIASILGPLIRRTFNFPTIDIDSSSSVKFDGGGGYDTDRSMDDRIPVVVEDVLPNGNLVVLGSRIRQYAGDSQVITVSGIVRPSDVSFDNSVSSSRVANFHIVHKTLGRENRIVNPGWATRLFNILNPF